MNPTNQPVSFYGDNSRNTDSALLATLATRDLDTVNAVSLSNVREEVAHNRFITKDSESTLRREVAESKFDLMKEISRELTDIKVSIKENREKALEDKVADLREELQTVRLRRLIEEK